MDFNTTNVPKFAMMESATFTGMAHTIQTATLAALVFAVVAVIPKLLHRAHLAKLPAYSGVLDGEKHRQGYLKSAKELYSEGYRKVT